MKKTTTYIYLGVIIIAMFTVGCEKFLDQDLLGQRSDENFYQTAEDAELALTGIYNNLTFANADNRLWVFGDIASDDAAKGGIPGDQADIQLVDDFNVTADNGNLETVWSICYEGVSRANKLLDNIDGIEMDSERRSQIKGEALFLRAYYYYWLANIFGDIPIHLTIPSPEEMQKGLTPYEDVLSNVLIPDLTSAAQLLPPTFSGGDMGRAGRTAALSLLGKVYLLQKSWNDAELALMDVVDLNVHSLLPVYRNNFERANKDNSETIFGIQHLSGQNPWLGNRLNQWFAPRSDNGYGFNVPTQAFVDEFEITTDSVYDPRLDYTVGREGQPWFNDTLMFDPSWSPTGYMQKKYLQPLEEVPIEMKADGELNYQFIRYADVLLMLAEALNEQGKSGQAVDYLNMIRTRARESYLYDEDLSGYGSVPDGLLPDVTSTGQSSLRDAIRHERRVELGFEFHRYFDVIRYGEQYANQVFSDKENFSYQEHKHFSIPQSELDTNNEIK